MYWLKLASRKRSRERRESREIMEGRKEWRDGFWRTKETDYERERDLQEGKGVKLMTVVEWCVLGAKDLRFIGREFHKWGEGLQNDRSAHLSLVETGGRKRHRWSEERVLLGGLIFMSLWRYFGSAIWRRLCVTEIIYKYWIRYSTLSQWRDLSTGEMWKCLEVRVTAHVSPFWMCWRRLIWVMGRPW